MRCLLPLLCTLFAVASAQYGQEVGMTQFVNSIMEGSRAEDGSCKNIYEVVGLQNTTKHPSIWYCSLKWNKERNACLTTWQTSITLNTIQLCAKTCFNCNRTKIELATTKECQNHHCNFRIDTKTETAMTSCDKKRQRRSADPVVCTEVTAETGKGETVLPLPSLNMSCDSTTDGGRWIVFMRRVPYMQDVDYSFDRDWQAYKTGFGSPEGNFWWGLEKLHRLVADGKFELRIDITTKEERKIVVTNDYFMVNNEDEKYAFNASGPFKVNGTSVKKIHKACGEPSFKVEKLNFDGLKGQFFTTKDVDNYVPDINECEIDNGICGHGTCVNTKGSFECICKDGYYSIKGYPCVMEGSCDSGESGSCGPRARCEYIMGSSVCRCKEGLGYKWGKKHPEHRNYPVCNLAKTKTPVHPNENGDTSEKINCAVLMKMGFWYNGCSSDDSNDGIKLLVTAPFVEMKVRQRQDQTENTRKRHILKKRSLEEMYPALCTDTTPNMETCPRVPLNKILTKAECKKYYDGSWMVIQRRSNNKTDFDRTWDEYKSGFGDPHNGGSFWWGLENLHRLTTSGEYSLKFDIYYQDGLVYDASGHPVDFRVLSEKDNYKLEVGDTQIAGGADLSGTMRPNIQFTTKDRDNTEHSLNCAKKYGGGFWWITHRDKKTRNVWCVMSINFNGIYGDTGEKGLLWYSHTGRADYPNGRFSYMEMKIRPLLDCPDQ